MATAVAASGRPGSERLRRGAVEGAMLLGVLAALWALWEGFKWFGEAVDLTLGNFVVNDRTLPHLH